MSVLFCSDLEQGFEDLLVVLQDHRPGSNGGCERVRAEPFEVVEGERRRFRSWIPPPYLWRSVKLSEVLPGFSTCTECRAMTLRAS